MSHDDTTPGPLGPFVTSRPVKRRGRWDFAISLVVVGTLAAIAVFWS